jgi:hypothetical protein
MTLLQTRGPGRAASSPERPLSFRLERSGLAGYLLAWAAALAYCSGLVGLAVSPAFEVGVPRWFILACGGGCALAALVAPLLNRPWPHPEPPAGWRAAVAVQPPAPVPALPRVWGAAVGQEMILRRSGSEIAAIS